MTTLALPPPTGPRPGPRGPVFGPVLGLGISLLVHAAVLAWLMHAPAPRPPDEAPAARMQVWLVPPRPALPVQPEAKATPLPAQPAAVRAAAPHRRPHRELQAVPHAPARASETPPVISVPPGSARDVFAVPPAASSSSTPDTDTAPVVDLAAARAAARRIAREDGKNLVSLPARKPVVDPNADRQVVDPIEAARRSDCETAYAGLGLLAVIPLIKDAVTGTGCRW